MLCELTLRTPRDPAIAAMLRQTDDPWHAYLAGLLRDAGAAAVVAAIKGLSMPNADGCRAQRIDETFRQLHC